MAKQPESEDPESAADETDFHDGDDDDGELVPFGQVVISLESGEDGSIQLAVPAEMEPDAVERYLAVAVAAIGKLKTQMQ